MLTRYGVEFHRGNEKLIFIIVVHESKALQEVQEALEFQGWKLIKWTPILTE